MSDETAAPAKDTGKAKLTANQQQAVEHDGHLLIVAGPGSGKTSTSISKAHKILSDPQRSLIMVTFTKEGSTEMQRRLVERFKQTGQELPGENRLIVATFHSIAIKHLFRHVSRQKVMSPAQQSLLLHDASNACHFAPKRPGVDDEEKEARKGFETYQYSIDRSNMPLTKRDLHLTMRLVEAYEERLRGTGMIDLYTVMRDCALKTQDGTIPIMPFTDMIVDEGQDTDDLQRAWIFAHARGSCRVAIVGDDDQSIYEWRQALGYQGMKSFMDTFKARRIELGDNFRCKSEILKHAVFLVEHNKNRLSKTLVAKRGKGGKIFAISNSTEEEQHAKIVNIITKCPDAHSNTAILARNNLGLDALELELRAAGIEYRRIGKSIWDSYYIAGYIGFLSSLIDNNPIGLLQALHLRGLRSNVKSELLMLFKGDAGQLLDGKVPELDTGTPEDLNIIKTFAKDCAYWRRQLRGSGLGGSATEVVLDVGQAYSDLVSGNYQKKLLLRCADILGKLKGSLASRLRISSTRSRDMNHAIVLMTMHASKGLEFNTVHLVDVNHKDEATDVKTDEAERRLLYVALTRAKDLCTVSYYGSPHLTVAEAAIPDMYEISNIVAEINRESSVLLR